MLLLLKKTSILLLILYGMSCQSVKVSPQDRDSNGKNSEQVDLNNKSIEINHDEQIQKSKAKDPFPGHYVVVKDKSYIKFNSTAKMLGITSDVPGQFTEFTIIGNKDQDLDKSNVEVVIAAKSIDTDNAKRDRHLRTAEFFDVDNFKNIRFKSKKIKKLKEGSYEVTGDLTIKDHHTNITFQVSVEESNQMANAFRIKGEAILNRNKVGIDYKSPFYLPDIGEEIKVFFDILGSLRQP